ncbi:unnamed protein product [Clavelina lepadiformis]|uniref:Uncharacterized protein n=1 Tax=Clavelina lepadiformis TaxID=159417 RepID=A0ABP0F532_CLALP
MATNEQILHMLQHVGLNRSVVVVHDENSRKCLVQEDPKRQKSAPSRATVAGNTKPLASLAATLKLLNDEERTKLVKRARKILESAGDVISAIHTVYTLANTNLRKALLKDLISFIESDATSLLDDRNFDEEFSKAIETKT